MTESVEAESIKDNKTIASSMNEFFCTAARDRGAG